MGILQSIMQCCFGRDNDEEENVVISSLHSYYNLNNNGEKLEYADRRRDNNPQQWQDGNRSTLSHQFMKRLTVSVPGSGSEGLSSLLHNVDTSVNYSPHVFTKQNTPHDRVKGRLIKKKNEEEEAPAKIKVVAVAEGRWKGHGIEKQNEKEEQAPVKIKMVAAAEGRGKGHRIEKQNEEEAPAKIKEVAAAAEGRWIKHYSSCHRILLVGEGDFSFSTCLAATFCWAPNMVATSLDSQAFLKKNYRNALRNISELSIRKCKVMHEIDATEMANHAFLGGIKFDRIIFNFPFAGFFKDLSRKSQLERHRRVVSQFLKNAREMISENGEIHITHKTNGFHKEWKLKSVASSHRLKLVEAVDFSLVDYPGYNTKCGFGGDNNFDCYPSKTYKFRL